MAAHCGIRTLLCTGTDSTHRPHMRSKNLLYFAGAALLGIVRGELAIRTRGQRLTLRDTMSKAKYHEVTCLNEECDVKGLIPNRAKTSLCPGCAAAQNKKSKFISTATKQ